MTVPGLSQRINADSVAPLFLVYERLDARPAPRVGRCKHVIEFLSKLKKFKRCRDEDCQRAKLQARRDEEELTAAARKEDELCMFRAQQMRTAGAGLRPP